MRGAAVGDKVMQAALGAGPQQKTKTVGIEALEARGEGTPAAHSWCLVVLGRAKFRAVFYRNTPTGTVYRIPRLTRTGWYEVFVEDFERAAWRCNRLFSQTPLSTNEIYRPLKRTEL